MYKTTAQLKAEAKKAMNPQMGSIISMLIMIIIISIVFLILTSFLPLNDTVVDFVDEFVIASIQATFAWRLLTVFRRPNEIKINPVNDITKRFKNPDFFTIIKTSFSQILFTYLWAVIPFLIGGFIIAAGDFSRPAYSMGCYPFGSLFIIIGIIMFCIKTFSYSLSNFLAYDEMKRTEQSPAFTYGISASKELMKGQKGRLFWLYLTFIPWYLLILVSFGWAILYVAPYIQLTTVAFYEELLEKRTTSSDEF